MDQSFETKPLPKAPPRYAGFISYSQTDKVSAVQIQRWLERYRLPRDVAKTLNRPRTLGRFFRDDDEMSASPDIARQINEAIDASECLIVICSPRSAQSQWVEAEIQQFRATGRGNKVFAFIVEGEPNAEDPALECFPPSLRRHGVIEGKTLPIEPLGLDLRKDGKERACARLVAGLLDVDFDTLWRRQRRRAIQRSAVVVAAILAVLSIYAASLLERTRDFNGQKSEFFTQLARLQSEAVESDMDDDRGQYDRAIRFAMLATREGWLHPKNNAARDELAKALHAIPNSLQLSPPDTDILMTFISPGRSELAMLDTEGVLTRINLGGMYVSSKFDLGITQIRAGTYHPLNQWLAVDSADGTVHIVDLQAQKIILSTPPLGQQVSSIQFSDDGKMMLVLGSNTYTVWELSTGQAIDRFVDRSVRIWQDTQWIPNSSNLLVASQHQENNTALLRLRDPKAASDLREFGDAENAVLEVAMSKSGKHLFALVRRGELTSEDFRIARVDLETFEEVGSIKAKKQIAIDFELDETERYLAIAHTIETGCHGRYLDIYNLQRTGEPKSVPLSTGACANQINLDPSGERIFTSHGDGVVRAWDHSTNSPTEAIKLQRHNGETIVATHYLPIQNALITHGGDGTVVWWDLSSYNNFAGAYAFDRQPEGLEFGGAGRSLLAWSKGDVILIENIAPGASPETGPAYRALLDLPFGANAEIRSAAFSATGERVVMFGSNGEIVDAAAPDWTINALASTDPIAEVVTSSDKSYAAILTESGVSLLNLSTRSPPRALTESSEKPRRARFSFDGSKLAAIFGSGDIHVWNTATGDHLQAIETGALGEIDEMVFAPNDLIALSGDFGFILSNAENAIVYDTSAVNDTFRRVGVMTLHPDHDWLYMQGVPSDPNFATYRFVARYNLKTFAFEDFLWSSTNYNKMSFIGPDRLMISQRLSSIPIFVMSPSSLQTIASRSDVRFRPPVAFDPASRRAAIGKYGSVELWDLNWATQEDTSTIRDTLCDGALGRNALTINEQDAQQISLISNLIGRNVCRLNQSTSDAGFDLLDRGTTPDDVLAWIGDPRPSTLSTTEAAHAFMARFTFDDLINVRGSHRDRALLIAASALASGIGVEKDLERAIDMYRELADRGHPLAMQNLAATTEQMSGRSSETLALVQQAADNDIWIAHRVLGTEALLAKNDAAARRHFETALALGDGQSAYFLGRFTEGATSATGPFNEQACAWFQNGIELADPSSTLAMTYCDDYLLSQGADPKTAIQHLLKLAAFQDENASIRYIAKRRYFESLRGD